jgi:O-antigen/teichoic acid export membrane protein
MTLWQRILQGIVALTTGTGIAMITGVVSAGLTFRYLTPDAYGRLSLFLSFYQTGNTILTLGLNGVITSEIARARGNNEWGWLRYVTGWYTFFVIAFSIIQFLIFWGIGQFSTDTRMWQIMGVYLLLSAPNNLVVLLFHSATRYRRMALLTVVRSLCRVILLATLPWWWFGDILTGVTLTYPFLEIVTLVTGILTSRHLFAEYKKAASQKGTYVFNQLWELIKVQGGYAILSVPVKNIAEQFPIWFLRVFAGETAVGLYSAAQRTFSFIFSTIRNIEITLFPLVAEQMEQAPERLKAALRQSQKYTLWFGVAVALGGSLLAPWILTLIAGEIYQKSIPLFRIIIWYLPLYAFAQSQRPLLFASGAQKWLFISYTIGAIAALITLPPAIMLMGIYGAAAGFIIYNGVVIGIRQRIVYSTLPQFWISPLTVFRLEPFDYQLWELVKKRIWGLITK